MSWPRIDGLRTLELGSPGALRNRLTDLVLLGGKRATAGLAREYEAAGEPLEQVGEQLVLVGDDGGEVARVVVTGVVVVAFAEVTDEFARAEGEGFTGRADWAAAHRGFWHGQGEAVDDATAVVCLRFGLLSS